MNSMIPIPGHPGYYASDEGYIYSEKRGNLKRLKGGKPHNGYIQIHLVVNGISTAFMAHRLILLTYFGECPEGMQTRHLNGIRDDNRISNLRWGTPEDNAKDKESHGTTFYPKGVKNGFSKLSENEVLEIRASARPATEIMEKFRISRTNVNAIRRKVLWAHL